MNCNDPALFPIIVIGLLAALKVTSALIWNEPEPWTLNYRDHGDQIDDLINEHKGKNRDEEI